MSPYDGKVVCVDDWSVTPVVVYDNVEAYLNHFDKESDFEHETPPSADAIKAALQQHGRVMISSSEGPYSWLLYTEAAANELLLDDFQGRLGGDVVLKWITKEHR